MEAPAPPARRAVRSGGLFAMALTLVGVAWLAAVVTATHQPSLGWELGVEGDAVVVAARDRDGLPPAGARLTAIQGAGGAPLPLTPGDLLEEPDLSPSYAAWQAFYDRQQALAEVLRSGAVTLHYAHDGAPRQATVQPTPRRPLHSLPPVFWFQLLVGTVGLTVGAWVLALRPFDAAARCLAFTGAMLLLAAGTAAVYSTRELALPADLFSALSDLNHLGTSGFGIGLVGIFWFSPRPLGSTRWWAAAAVLWAAWAAADIAWALPGPDWAMRAIVLTEMLAAVALGVAQWRRARGQPADRAALRWVLLSFLVGCGAFVVLVVCTTMLGWLPPLSQGYSFGFFLPMYVGLALGVRRYRLFDLDRWSLRVLMWVFGLVAVVAVDAVLVLLRVSETLSLPASILVCASVYFPLRQALWSRLTARSRPIEGLAGQIIALALAAPPARPAAWQRLLDGHFGPLRTEPLAAGPHAARLHEHGMALALPARHGLPALRLWQRDQGRRLFSTEDARLADRLLELAGLALTARDGHERGALAERQRIAADLHDDLGARLLSITRTGDVRAAQLAREALDDLRLALQGLVAPAAPAADAVADWRAETVSRAQAAGLDVDWDADCPDALQLPPRVRLAATRVLREAVTNAIKHAKARRLQVQVRAEGGELHLQVRDDGIGLPPQGASPLAARGLGLPGIARRVQSLGGQVRIGPRPDAPHATGTEVAARFPLEVPAS